MTGDEAKYEDLYQVGTIVNIKRMMRNEGIMQLVVQGLDRFKVLEWTQSEPFFEGKMRDPARPDED